jgi:transcriptional regulator with XRE-family HTH domain
MVGKKAAGTDGFVRRLNQVCDDVPHIIPPHGEGRQIELAKRMDMSQEGVRKWFAGEAMPRREPMQRLAKLLEVEEPWLALGISPEITEAEKKVNARNVEGASLVVMGLMILAGANCAQPGEGDPRRKYIDFYAILRGVQFAVHVSLAREISSGHFQLLVPREFKQVREVAVIPVGNGKVEFVDLPSNAVDAHKVRKGGHYAISVNRIEGRYVTGNHTWARIKNFGDLA